MVGIIPQVDEAIRALPMSGLPDVLQLAAVAIDQAWRQPHEQFSCPALLSRRRVHARAPQAPFAAPSATVSSTYRSALPGSALARRQPGIPFRARSGLHPPAAGPAPGSLFGAAQVAVASAAVAAAGSGRSRRRSWSSARPLPRAAALTWAAQIWGSRGSRSRARTRAARSAASAAPPGERDALSLLTPRRMLWRWRWCCGALGCWRSWELPEPLPVRLLPGPSTDVCSRMPSAGTATRSGLLHRRLAPGSTCARSWQQSG